MNVRLTITMEDERRCTHSFQFKDVASQNTDMILQDAANSFFRGLKQAPNGRSNLSPKL
jgi:hypothetical protein